MRKSSVQERVRVKWRDQVQAGPTRLLLITVILSIGLRLGSAFFLGNEIGRNLPGIADEISYHTLALRVLNGYGFSFGQGWWPGTPANQPTAHWSYLYTLYLTAVYALFGPNPLVARLIQVVIVGASMPWLLFRLATRLFDPASVVTPVPVSKTPFSLGRRVGLAAAAISAVYVYFVYYAGALLTESFYFVAILWTLDQAMKIRQDRPVSVRPWLTFGLASAVCILLRQVFLLFMPFLLLWLWWSARPRLAQILAAVAVVALMIMPWTLRNYLAFGQFVPLNTNSGFALYWGNHPSYGTRFVPIRPTLDYYNMIPDDLRQAGLSEAAMDSALLKLALREILGDPARFLALSISRIPPYFVFWPMSASSTLSNLSRVGSFGLFMPFMLYGLVMSWRRARMRWQERVVSPVFLVYLFFIIYTGVHVVTWTLIRYRLPLDTLLVLFAGWTLVDLLGRLRVRQQQPRTTTVQG